MTEVGVLVPLIVVPVALVPGHDFPPEVVYVAVDGNRRQAAAHAAGLPLPCIVRADLAAAKDTARTMAVTGLVRDALTAAEEAHAVAALFELKYSAAAISRATGRSKNQLATARKAATLTAEVTDEVAAYPLTIDQLAVIAQHQDHPDAVAALIDAADKGQFDHVAARLRARQLEDEAVAKRCAELTAQRVTVVDEEPSRHGTGPARPLDALRPADTTIGTELTAELHAGCPGHAAYVSADYYDADPDEDRAEELDLHVAYLCTDADHYGHLPRYRDAVPRPAPPGEDATDAEQKQARAAETRRAERRDLIRLNKEADAATQVRRQYLHQCLTAKSLHKAMAAWALAQVVYRDPTYSRWASEYYRTPPILTEILGRDPPRGRLRDPGQPAWHPALGARGVRERGRPAPRFPPGQRTFARRVPFAPADPGLHPVRGGTADPDQRHPRPRAGRPGAGRPAGRRTAEPGGERRLTTFRR